MNTVYINRTKKEQRDIITNYQIIFLISSHHAEKLEKKMMMACGNYNKHYREREPLVESRWEMSKNETIRYLFRALTLIRS